MLQISNIFKQYKTGELVQKALDDVSLTLRDNEFVAILGPSGSGKTTLLNIIGGLDRYDKGDLIINGISTKNYKDRDWDSYRNHTVGFVFQSYNLIPHQSVLSNVELALTISGVSKSERRKRAKEALEKVGLGEQLHKKPNQMSGGQMQRVAIARALVNDPDILLADEPTGALDSETSVQVMNLLKEVAKDRLVVMVTHNPELAEEYANRIIKLRDGKVKSDSNAFEVNESQIDTPKHKNMGKASMSWLTALSLSFNNLKTKKGRTFLTAFAGSIGIIGIALILSLSNGVNTYITDIQKSTMSSYPIEIESQTMDLSSLMEMERPNMNGEKDLDHSLEGVYSNTMELELASTTTTSLTENNLSEFKKYLDNKDSEIHNHIGENGIVYSYDTKFDVLTYDPNDVLVNTNGSTLSNSPSQGGGMMGMGGMSSMMGGTDNNFQQIIPGTNGDLISKAIIDNYDLVHGQWPSKYDEVVLVLDRNNEISATKLYELGLLPTEDYKEIMQKLSAGEALETKTDSWTYEEILAKEFYMIPASDYYVEDENGNFNYIANDKIKMEELMESALKLKISGIIRINSEAQTTFINEPVGYTKALTDYIIEHTDNSPVVLAQKSNPDVNVINGMAFAPSDDAAKINDAKEYFANLGVTDKANIFKDIIQSMAATNPEMAAQLSALTEAQMAQRMDIYLQNPEDDMMLNLYDSYISPGTYDENMTSFGVVSLDAPSSISIYADSFEDKDLIAESISKYNETVSEEDKIVYTDLVALLMSSITTIIDVISYVLVAFVAVSLVVSSIMIGIITFISVLERTKEIGILRAMGASKSNISQVFNAETFIVGLFAGLLGVGISALLLIPGNVIIQALTNNTDVKAILPPEAAVILVILSVILTLIGGFIPAKKAAKKDPVIALRTE